MPDTLKQTLSATQTPALFGVSPYLTRWMLLRHFIHGDDISSPEHNRMNWGKKLQPLIIEQAAAELHLEVRPNADDIYVRRGLIGCTRDAEIICPDRGPGALETKCVFDLGIWMRDWGGGKTVPKQNEIQLQQQMMVGDGADGPQYQWGVIVAWVCGDLHYFERKPIPDLWKAIDREVFEFFVAVEKGDAGQPFGEPIELPLIGKLFEPVPGKVIDLTTGDAASELAGQVQMLDYHSRERKAHEKGEATLKARIRALIGDAEEAHFADGIRVKQKKVARAGYQVKPSTYTTLDVYVPAK